VQEGVPKSVISKALSCGGGCLACLEFLFLLLLIIGRL